MDKNEIDRLIQQYAPFILIALTVLFGGYLMFKKGIFTLPTFGKKEKAVDIGNKNVVDILFADEEYKLSYGAVPADSLVNIAKFDKSETWQGEGSLEEGATRDESVISIIDRDRQKAEVYLFKPLNLAAVGLFKLTVNLKTEPDDLESFNILFSDKDLNNYYRFPATNLTEGMNFLSIPKHRFFLSNTAESNDETKKATSSAANIPFTWDKVERVQLELVSRPGTKANLEVGWLRGEKEELFDKEWQWDGYEHFLNLATAQDGKTTLYSYNIGKGVATLKKVGSVKDFSFSTKITAMRPGSIGLFVRGDYKTGFGYYFAVGGLDSNEWSVTKYYLASGSPKTSALINGQISNFAFSKDQPFWLKATLRDNSLTLCFSLDNKDFTKLGNVTDNTFDAGGVGIAVAPNGAGFFDDFNLLTK